MARNDVDAESVQKSIDEKSGDGSAAEKANVREYVVQTDPRYHFDAADLDKVQRRLKQRHVQMIAVSYSRLFPICRQILRSSDLVFVAR